METTGQGGETSVFSRDKRFWAYNALLILLFYMLFRRCVTLIGPSPCMDRLECPPAVEWFVVTVSAMQTMVSIAVATVHRPSSTVDLFNGVNDVLTRDGDRYDRQHGGGGGNVAKVTWWPHWWMAGAYAATFTVTMLCRLVTMNLARPDRFTVADVLLVYLPVAVVPVVVECAYVSVCCTAENVCRNTVDRLLQLATACDVHGRGSSWAKCRPVHWQLEMVWHDYWRGCRLVNRLSRCYGLDLAVNLTMNMLLFVGYAYVCFTLVLHRSRKQQYAVTDYTDLYWNVSLACQMMIISFRIVFVSHRAEKIKQVGTNSVLKSLRNLLKNNNLDTSTVILINSFTYQIKNRELKISACGFFSVNLSFFHALIRLATTYLIVIIQYDYKDPEH